MPFTGLNGPWGWRWTTGNVYVTDRLNHRVVELLAGSNTQVELPLAGLSYTWAVAVGTAGDVYVTSASYNGVLKLPAGSNTQVELPFTGLNSPPGSVAQSTSLHWTPQKR